MKTTHEMRLNRQPFEEIKTGRKIYELRLFDEKRRKIAVGDEIVFTAVDNGERFSVRVDGLLVFNDFFQLYAQLPAEELGYKMGETPSPDDMFRYYDEKDIKLNGVIAIKISLIV